MILVFDTETTGFPSSKLSPDDPGQARIIQLAWLLLDDNFKERGSFCSLIKLDDRYSISEGARNAHGISDDDCRKYGVGLVEAMNLFTPLLHICHTVVAHNIKFDSQLIDIEHQILYSCADYDWSSPKNICTMQLMTPICRLPGGKFGSKWKWPKLAEAYRHCFGEELVGAHDALNDCRATARVLRWLRDNGHVVPNSGCEAAASLATLSNNGLLSSPNHKEPMHNESRIHYTEQNETIIPGACQ